MRSLGFLLALAIAASAGLHAGAQPQAQARLHIDPAIFDFYVGRYQLSPTFVLTVTKNADRLYVEVPGQERRQLLAMSETEFIVNGVGLRIIFGIREDTREVDHLIFNQGGIGRRADRLGRDVAVDDPRNRVALSVPAETLERYVGVYEEQPGFAITITRDGDHLMAQMTEQAIVEIFAESETDFFYRTMNAQIAFRVENDGMVEGLVLHQGGGGVEMTKIERPMFPPRPAR